VRRVVQAVDAKAGLGEQVRVTALPARHVEDPCASGQREDLHQPSDFFAVPGEAEDRLVLEQVVGVEVGRPPITGLRILAH
jgi:hypothetical protein